MNFLPGTTGGKTNLKEESLNEIHFCSDKSIMVSHFHWQNSGLVLAAKLAEKTAGNYRLQFIKVLKHMSNFN